MARLHRSLGWAFGGWAAAILIGVGHVGALAQTSAPLAKIDAIYNALPESVRKSGVINAATEPGYPPFEFLDAKNELIGADIDLSAALGQILGVTVKNNNTEFSNIIPGLESKRFDIGVSSMGDYVSRQKVVDFVDYYVGGASFLIKVGSPEPKQAADLCGTRVGVQKGTSSETQAEGFGKSCIATGKKTVEVNAYPTQTAAVLALNAGRIDSVLADSATNAYSMQQTGGGLKSVGHTIQGERPYYGIAVPKGSPLYQPIFDAMAALMASGRYKEILVKWGLDAGAMDKPIKNGGTTG